MGDFFFIRPQCFEAASSSFTNCSTGVSSLPYCCESQLSSRFSSMRPDDLDDEFDPFTGLQQLPTDNSDFSQSAPAQSQWLHGQITRAQAEERLRAFGQAGCYLIRQSDRKSGSFALSFLNENGEINHFRITAICGDFYIGGRRFVSLKQLVGYYTAFVDLLKNERLVFPVPPLEPVKDKQRVQAILPYAGMQDSDELSFNKGDIFVVHNNLGDGWIWCTSQRTGESGLVFRELVHEMEENSDPNEVYPWFISNISKQDAVDLLAKQGPGSFLVRPSDNSPGNYSLFFYVNKAVQRFRIERSPDGRYAMGGRYFSSLNDVIQRYRCEQIVAGYKLGQPVIRNVSNIIGTPHCNIQSDTAKELPSSSTGGGGFGSLLSGAGGGLRSACGFSGGRSCGSFSVLSGDSRSALGSGSLSSAAGSGGSAASCSSMDTEQIYATLRESREKTHAQRLQQKLSGFLHKKSQRSKKWKPFFFVLAPDEQTLYFYENERKVRPKGLIDLNCSYLYLVHETLFDKPHCVQLVEKALPCIASLHFISFASAESLQEWVQAIRPLCTPQNNLTNRPSMCCLTSPPEETATQIRTLHLHLLEARRLPVKLTPHPFCLISLNKQRVARTSVKCPPDPIYEEEFILEEIPADVSYFSITLFNKGKRSKDHEVAEVNVELSRLRSGEEVEEWFSLVAVMPTREDMGAIRARIRYVNELILPNFEYAALKQLLLQETPGLEIIALLEDMCPKDRTPLSSSLLAVLTSEGSAAPVLGRLLEREVAREMDSCTLFRMNSLTTSLMDGFMRLTCGKFLNNCLRVCLQRILSNKHSCELNPSRLDSLSAACANAEHLLQLLDALVENIFATLPLWPISVRYVCACVQRAVTRKWPENQLIRTQAVGSFIFLRLICPAILNPKQFNLISDIPSEVGARSLILIAKSLQNLSNLVEFGMKEPWMEVVNPFILKNKARMIKFVEELCNVQDLTVESDEYKPRGEPTRELATLHTICESHREEIANLSPNSPNLKKLITITDMLTSHKKRYQESQIMC